MTKHTSGPCYVERIDARNDLGRRGRCKVPASYAIWIDPCKGPSRIEIAYDIRNREDARRLAACWNACEGMENPENEIRALRNCADELHYRVDHPEKTEEHALRTQRDELLAVLKDAAAHIKSGAECHDGIAKCDCDDARLYFKLAAAIRKIEEES